MIEVIYTQTLKNVSRDEAITLVYGVERSGRSADRLGQGPSRRCRGTATTMRLCRIVADLEKAWPGIANTARMAAEAQLRGEPDAGFDAFRKAISRSSGRWRPGRGGAASRPRQMPRRKIPDFLQRTFRRACD